MKKTEKGMILVSGGAGFIGSNFVRYWLERESESVCVLDALTYAGNYDNLVDFESDDRFRFLRGDIRDQKAVDDAFAECQPRAILHFAAESHVDRSIENPAPFLETNVLGTFNLLETARKVADRSTFRFLHISSDEVYGSLQREDPPFTEQSPHRPSSPYSASKAASDHLVHAYQVTYGLPTLTINCSNNYGPRQFPEKLIPLMIVRALAGQRLPVYGDGMNVRDWLYVDDHCDAIHRVLQQGRVGETYNVGGSNEWSNIDLVHALCDVLNGVAPSTSGSYREKIEFVPDRPGHDFRYAIDSSKIQQELNWQAATSMQEGLVKTVHWYLSNRRWVERVQDGRYLDWVNRQYGDDKVQR
jgi:dTDP-glucose 4,6-dehydratase